jgi:parallel beta-helix repeat protein
MKKGVLILILVLASGVLLAFAYLDSYSKTTGKVISSEQSKCSLGIDILETGGNNWCSGSDFNHDGKVDARDLSVFKLNNGKKGSQLKGDANGDGRVNSLDVEILNQHWNETGCSGAPSFSIKKVESYYDSGRSFSETYNPKQSRDIVLMLYASSGSALGRYWMYSSRLIFYDSFNDTENPGGVIEASTGVLHLHIPYFSKLAKITVVSGGKKYDLKLNSSQLSRIKCKRDCRNENEIVAEEEHCCRGYSAVQEGEDYFCTQCGDGVCGAHENGDNCFVDCRKEIPVYQCGELYWPNAVYKMENDISVLDAVSDFTCFNITSDGITLDGNGFSVSLNGGTGISASNVENAEIRNIKINRTYIGILLEGVINSSVTESEVYGNAGGGIILKASSGNRLVGNDLHNNDNIVSDGFGIRLSENSDFNLISGGRIRENTNGGIMISGSNGNTIDGVECGANYGPGIKVEGSANTSIKRMNMCEDSIFSDLDLVCDSPVSGSENFFHSSRISCITQGFEECS